MSGGGLLDDQFFNTLIGSTAAPGLGFTLHGETVTYTVLGDPGTAPSSSSVTAVRVPTSDIFEPETSEQTGWTVSSSDVADPLEGDKITDDEGETWVVVRSAPKNGGVFFLLCEKAKLN